MFFRAAMRAWADWYRKTLRTRKPGRVGGKRLRRGRFGDEERASPPPSADALRRLTGKRGDLATSALLRSHGPVGTAGALDRRTLDCVVARRMTIAAADREVSLPCSRKCASFGDEARRRGDAFAGLRRFGFSFRDADPDAKPLVASWARRVARAASDAEAYAEDARALDETVAARAVEVDECARDASPGRAIASLELAVSEERWADAARWRDALRARTGGARTTRLVFG